MSFGAPIYDFGKLQRTLGAVGNRNMLAPGISESFAAAMRPAWLDAVRGANESFARPVLASQALNESFAMLSRPAVLDFKQSFAAAMRPTWLDAVRGINESFARPVLASQALNESFAALSRLGWAQFAALGAEAAMLDVARQGMADGAPGEAEPGAAGWWVARLPRGMQLGILLALLTLLDELSLAVEEIAPVDVPEAAQLAPGAILAVATLILVVAEARKNVQ